MLCSLHFSRQELQKFTVYRCECFPVRQDADSKRRKSEAKRREARRQRQQREMATGRHWHRNSWRALQKVDEILSGARQTKTGVDRCLCCAVWFTLTEFGFLFSFIFCFEIFARKSTTIALFPLDCRQPSWERVLSKHSTDRILAYHAGKIYGCLWCGKFIEFQFYIDKQNVG